MPGRLIDEGERRLRVWVLILAGTLTAVLLLIYGERTATQIGAARARSGGATVAHFAEVVDVDYRGGEGGYAGTSVVQTVLLRLDTGAEVSFTRRADPIDVHEGERVVVEMWHSVPVRVAGVELRGAWGPGWGLGFVFLPPAFVLAAIQAVRLRQLARGRSERVPFSGNSSVGYVIATFGLAFVTGLALVPFQDVPWLPIPEFLATTAVPLAWFAVRERRTGGRAR